MVEAAPRQAERPPLQARAVINEFECKALAAVLGPPPTVFFAFIVFHHEYGTMSGHPSDSLSVPALCHASAEDVPATGVRVPLRAGATGGLSASAATTRVLPTGRQATRGTLVRRAICLAIVLIGLFPTSSTAAHLSATSVALIASGANPLASHSPSPSVQPLLADWLDKVLNPIVSGMRGRQRTIQVGAIMMVLALAVIWWRK